MKKYFVKLMPTTDKIKKGDSYLFVNNDILICKDDDEADRCNNHFAIKDNCKKLQLYLCSRDIQVGDKYWYELSAWDWRKGICHTEGEANRLRKTGLFKVIGEISPNALCVKDGDELNEDEIQIVYKKEFECLCGKTPSSNWWTKSNGCEYECEDHYNHAYTCFREKDVIDYIKVLQPCKHFH